MNLTRASLERMGFVAVGDGSAFKKVIPQTSEGTLAPSIQVPSPAEADLHERILAHCRAHRWPVVHARMDRPTTCGVGTPDFVIALPDGRTLWIEAKRRFRKPTSEQNAWLAALRVNGHQAEVVRNLADFHRAVAVAGIVGQ